ncbi:MAG: M24 family metallopeptidase [Alphaproteobacteria bacterium]|nr:M24 family metallopeptidase [Alphaproteobacteria bacterium]
MPAFETAEYLARIAETKARMAAAGIDVLLVSSPANINYLSGYDGQSFYTHQVLILAAEEAEPVWIGRAMDVTGAELTAFMTPGHAIGFPDAYVGVPENHPMKFVAEYLRSKGWARRTFGVELDEFFYTARCHAELARGLPDARLVDANLLVNWVRLKKSPAELRYMEQAGRIATQAMAEAIDAIEPGQPQAEAMARLYARQARGVDGYCGDFICKAPNVGTGERAQAVHLHWEDKVHRAGETTWLELAGCRYHYHAPLTRTVHLGKTPPRMEDAGKALVEGLDAALAAARPGATCAEVAAAFQRVAERHGITKTTRIGYPVGVAYPPNWGELTASLRAGDGTVLEEGMAFHCIPGVWSKAMTVVISESFQVTARGGQPFCDAPRRLFVKA